MGVENGMFRSEIGSGFEDPGGTPPPRIPRSTPPGPHHSVTLNAETLPNSASISGPSKITTASTLFLGTSSHRTRCTTAQAKDVTSTSKKNS